MSSTCVIKRGKPRFTGHFTYHLITETRIYSTHASGFYKSPFRVLEDIRANNMALLINYGREMLRINTQKNTIEYSTNDGRSWLSRYTGSSAGIFYDLFQFGKELLACTSKGIFYSTNEGRSWLSRCTSSSAGTFQQLSTDGRNLLATTSKGLYYSTNEGRSWLKR